MSIAVISLVCFISQVIFSYLRTWNIESISDNRVFNSVLSNSLIQIFWLVSISINLYSIREILIKDEPIYIIVVFSYLIGGALGVIISMKNRGK